MSKRSTDFQVGQRVVIVGKTYHGCEGRVASTGNNTVFVLSKSFGKGWRNAFHPRGFHPDDVADAGTEEAAWARYAKNHRDEDRLPPSRYGGADPI